MEEVNQMTVASLQKNLSSYPLSLEDFFVLLSFVTSKSKTFLLAHPEYCLSQSEETNIHLLIQRRLTHEPVAYLTGQKEFYGRTFIVNPSVLIPRPETEVLIEEVLSYTQEITTPTTFIDIGTGSGAIILTLAEELAKREDLFHFIGVDISKKALLVAEENKKCFQNKTVTLQESDLLSAVRIPKEENLCIIANLPYLPTAMYESTLPDVKNFEPMIALESGADGLNHYRRLLEELKALSLPSFTLFIEIDPSQTETLLTLFHTFPKHTINIIPDLTGRERFIQISVS